jgi:RNA polymerase sigma factor (sigma-70 family)
VRGYLYRSILNAARGRARKRALERRFLSTRDPRGGAYLDDPSTLVDDRDSIWRALEILPPRQKAVLFLRFYADLSEDATADALDCSVSAVKSLTSRATKRLRGEIGKGAND